jgi:lipoyl(octanoyl) transferase
MPSTYGLKPVPFTEGSFSATSEARVDSDGVDLSADALTYEKRPAGAERKIGAIGIHVSRGITSHGFAFNVTTDLKDFTLIIPCGIPDHAVTSLALEAEKPEELPALEAIAHAVARQFGQVFGEQVLAVEGLAALRAEAAAVQFPAEDTPLQIPVEVERLLGGAERTIRA